MMQNVLISFLKEYRKLCHVIDNIITMKDTCLHNLGKFFHIWCEIQAMFDILIFSKIHHFEVAKNFLLESIPEVMCANGKVMNIFDILKLWSTL